ncbi:hypothetical protein GOP47_0028654 [Adiantum capillus-veneris]|nr:hypothetical protein GOP47_0028654 [Adiantum capillus-veneris]
MSYQTSRADKPDFPAENDSKEVEMECNMCGDVGLREQLIPCRAKGCQRYQHTYCSNWYPQEKPEFTGLCNWCVAASLASTSSPTKTTSLSPSNTLKAKTTNATHGCSNKSPSTSITRSTPTGRRYKLVSEM